MLFISSEKLFSFLWYLRFVTTSWSSRKNGLIRKIRLTSFSYRFCIWFFKKNVSCVTFLHSRLTKFHRLIAFISWDTRQYVYYHCLLTRVWRHKFWNYLYLSHQAVLLCGQNVKVKNFNILRMKRAFDVK